MTVGAVLNMDENDFEKMIAEVDNDYYAAFALVDEVERRRAFLNGLKNQRNTYHSQMSPSTPASRVFNLNVTDEKEKMKHHVTNYWKAEEEADDSAEIMSEGEKAAAKMEAAVVALNMNKVNTVEDQEAWMKNVEKKERKVKNTPKMKGEALVAEVIKRYGELRNEHPEMKSGDIFNQIGEERGCCPDTLKKVTAVSPLFEPFRTRLTNGRKVTPAGIKIPENMDMKTYVLSLFKAKINSCGRNNIPVNATRILGEMAETTGFNFKQLERVITRAGGLQRIANGK
jgi:hypothetical protein